MQQATEDAFLALADHLPAEAAEALLEYVGTGRLPRPAPVVAPADPFAHPDALRRFRVVENQEALALALDAPWERWAVFLHPAQQGIVDRSYNGPARTSGSAGTGKTVVALHRAARLARQAPDGRVLLTTFSPPLANALARKLAVLVGEDSPVLRRVTVAALPHRRRRTAPTRVRAPRRRGLRRAGGGCASRRRRRPSAPRASPRASWLPNGGTWWMPGRSPTWKPTRRVPRLGRKNRMSAGQRERLWPVFAAVRASLAKRGLATWPEIFGRTAAHYAGARRQAVHPHRGG